MDGPHRETRRRVTGRAGAGIAAAILGIAALSGTVARAEIPVMTGSYYGTNSSGSPMQLGVYDPETGPAPAGVLAYWNTMRMDTSGPFLSYGEDYPAENDQGYTSCSRNYGGFAVFTGTNTFAGTHSNTQGTWTLEGTVDAYGHASGTLTATLNSGVTGIPAVECAETFTVTHPDATDPPDDTSTTSPTTSTTTTTTVSPATSPPTTAAPTTAAPTTVAPATPSTLGATGDATSFVAGQTATFTGSGFQPGESVIGTFYSDPIPMGTVTADADGRAVFSFAIPTTVAAGQHTVRMVGATSGTVELAVTVSQPLSPALPATGDAHLGMLVAATVLVCMGAVMVGARRRPGKV